MSNHIILDQAGPFSSSYVVTISHLLIQIPRILFRYYAGIFSFDSKHTSIFIKYGNQTNCCILVMLTHQTYYKYFESQNKHGLLHYESLLKIINI